MADTREQDPRRKSHVPAHSAPPTDAIGSRRASDDEKPAESSPTGRDERLIGTERYPRKGDDPISDEI